MQFPFPFDPYPMQTEVMEMLYGSIEKKEVCLAEAPTGTGKSQMILNSVLSWLESNSTTSDEGVQCKQVACSWKKRNQRKKKRVEDADPNLLVQEKELSTFSSSSSDDSESDSDDSVCELPSVHPKVYLLSRTHSQLLQLMQELHKTIFSPRKQLESGVPNSAKSVRCTHLGSRVQLCVNESVKNLAKRSGGVVSERLNELCKESMENFRKSRDDLAAQEEKLCCPFADSKKLKQLREYVRGCPDRTMQELRDEGVRIGACPYWVARQLVKESNVVFMPYSYMIDEKMRCSLLGEDLEDLADDIIKPPTQRRSTWRRKISTDFSKDVIVFDEGHNVPDAAAQSSSSELTPQMLTDCTMMLSKYLQTYESRLLVRNKQKLRELILFCEKLGSYLATEVQKLKDGKQSSVTYKLSPFCFEAGIDNVNAFGLVNFLEQTELPRKLQGFVTPNTESLSPVAAHRNIYSLVSFMEKWARAQDDSSRILISTSAERINGSVELVALRPGTAIESIVDECHSLVLIGGTIQPFSLAINQLFHKCRERCGKNVVTKAFPHVVPSSSLLVTSLSAGPRRKPIELTYSNRSSLDEMLCEVSLSLVNISRFVPKGMVVFFPSYSMLESFIQIAKSSGSYDALNEIKAIVAEQRGKRSDEVLTRFKAYIDIVKAENLVPEDDDWNGETQIRNRDEQEVKPTSSRSAVLLAVMGGSLSEGINFNDDYGRCVVVVGLPYPNPNDPKLKLLASAAVGSSEGAMAYSSALCMRSVNQSIGRCIRHLNDYAAVVLLDSRYQSHKHVSQGISPWMRRSLDPSTGFADCIKKIKSFFETKR